MILRKGSIVGIVTCALLGLSSAWLGATPAAAADFYAGKTLNIIIGTSEAGGFSLYTRLITEHLGRYIPGHPTIVVRYMPGAGGAIAASFLYRKAPRDGTTIAIVPPDAIMDRLFGRINRVDPTKFEYLAGAERSIRLCATSFHSQVKTLQQALTHKVVMGATQQGSPTTDYANLIRTTTGAKFRVVNGYRGVGALYVAMERGEVDGMCGFDWGALKAQKAELLRDHKINLLVQMDVKSNPELDAMGVPQPWSFIHKAIDRQAVKLMVDFQGAFGKGYLAPPQVPADRIAILRNAFAAALHDKALLAEAKKRRIDVTPVTGAEIAATVRNLYSAPHAVVERLRQITAGANAK